jgi:hypothetical protein
MKRMRTTWEIKVNVAVASCLWALVTLFALLLGRDGLQDISQRASENGAVKSTIAKGPRESAQR